MLELVRDRSLVEVHTKNQRKGAKLRIQKTKVLKTVSVFNDRSNHNSVPCAGEA